MKAGYNRSYLYHDSARSFERVHTHCFDTSALNLKPPAELASAYRYYLKFDKLAHRFAPVIAFAYLFAYTRAEYRVIVPFDKQAAAYCYNIRPFFVNLYRHPVDKPAHLP